MQNQSWAEPLYCKQQMFPITRILEISYVIFILKGSSG